MVVKVLFIHQNFPGQFRHLAPALAQDPKNQVLALSMKASASSVWQGVQVIPYRIDPQMAGGSSLFAGDLEVKLARAEACYQAACQLLEAGFIPDLIIAHPGWGESLYLKEVWPQARLNLYCEFFYRAQGLDVGFDPQQTALPSQSAHRFGLKNINNLLHMELANAGLSPTHWQASTFPEYFRSKITVIHDGIDTQALCPDDGAFIQLGPSLVLDGRKEVITFISRDLEPYRGYHKFMHLLPSLLQRRPEAHIVIVGGPGCNYGPLPPTGQTWMQIFASSARQQISANDWSRVHFVGKLSYADYVAVLRVSRVHLYWTYPFVLSWSLLESMACGGAIIASDTGPVKELIEDGVNGWLAPFFDEAAWLDQIDVVLGDACLRQKTVARARDTIISRYDLRTQCLPGQIAWVEKTMAT